MAENKVMARNANVNWPGVFSGYCMGTPVEELARSFEVSVWAIKEHIRSENWVQLRANLPLGDVLVRDAVTTPDVVKRLEVIQKNRQENLRAFVELREHAIEVVKKLKAGTLKVEKLFNHKTLGIIREEVEPSSGDLVNIATYLRTISDGTYRALGDISAQEKPAQDGPAGSGQQAAITIILPNVIAAPREQRNAIQGQVIDLRPQCADQVPTLDDLQGKDQVPAEPEHMATSEAPEHMATSEAPEHMATSEAPL